MEHGQDQWQAVTESDAYNLSVDGVGHSRAWAARLLRGLPQHDDLQALSHLTGCPPLSDDQFQSLHCQLFTGGRALYLWTGFYLHPERLVQEVEHLAWFLESYSSRELTPKNPWGQIPMIWPFLKQGLTRYATSDNTFQTVFGVCEELILLDGVSDFVEPTTPLQPLPLDLESKKVGLRDIAQYLGTPRRCGIDLSITVLQRFAREHRLPMGFGGRVNSIENLLHAAADFQKLSELWSFLCDQLEQTKSMFQACPLGSMRQDDWSPVWIDLEHVLQQLTQQTASIDPNQSAGLCGPSN